MPDDRDRFTAKTPPEGVKRALTSGGSAVPSETWEGEDQKSGVHSAEHEAPLDTIERITRDVRKTGAGTLEQVKEHGADIALLKTKVEALEITTSDIKTLNEQQNGKLDLNNSKTDAILVAVKALDPNAPHIVRQIVQEELRISTITESHAQADGKRKLTQITIEQVGKIAAAMISAGIIGALLQSHSC